MLSQIALCTLLLLTMNEATYKKIQQGCELLVTRRTPSPIFQQRLEQTINGVEANGYAQCPSSHIIRLKNPGSRNDIKRGLKVCLENAFMQKYAVEEGDMLFKFKPLISIIKYQDEYCAECGKNLGESTEVESCIHCSLRKFCTETCKMRAMVSWHDLECDFMRYLEQELVLKPTNKDQQEPNEGDVGFVESLVTVLLTVFRLLLKLSEGDSGTIELVLNMSDHMSKFESWLAGESKESEHDELFELTKNKMAKLMAGYFASKRFMFNKGCDSPKYREMNIYGIYRAFLIVFINSTGISDSYGDTIGMMFDPLFAMINHSCDPNTTIVWGPQNQVMIKALKYITPAEEITINYSPSTIPIEMRQMCLLRSFFFRCECPLCQCDTELGDPTLPVDCDKCGFHVSGFRLHKFFDIETKGAVLSSRNVSVSKQCPNCDGNIEISQVFHMYGKLLFHIKFITKVKNVELLFDWVGETETLSVMTPDMMLETASLFKQAYGLVPVRSWPMLKLIGLLRVFQKEINIGSLNLIRLTLLGVLVGESSFERKSKLRVRSGNQYHEMCVVCMGYLAKEYSTNREHMNVDLFVVVGRAIVCMAMVGYECMMAQYGDSLCPGSKTHVPIMEEMKQMGKDANRLIKKVRPETYMRKTTIDEIAKTIGKFAERMSMSTEMHLPTTEFPNAGDFGIIVTGKACAQQRCKRFCRGISTEWVNSLI